MNITQLISRSAEGFVFGTGDTKVDQTRGLATLARDIARRSVQSPSDAKVHHTFGEGEKFHGHDFLGESKQKSTEKNFLLRLADLGNRLSSSHEKLKSWAETQGSTSAGVEWLLDNFFVIQKQLEEVKESIPGKYLEELPKLSSGASLFYGMPRVFILAGELVRVSAGVVNMAIIDVLIREFQTITPLSMGELWAFPNFLRVALLGNISRAAQRLVDKIEPIQQADDWSARLTSHRIEERVSHSQQFVAKPPPTNPTFLLRLMSNLRASRVTQAVALLDSFLKEEGIDLEDLARTENARVALINVTMQHSITSLRSISGLDWRGFFERHNVTEEILRTDNYYSSMTFTSRDIYRHAVEGLARGSNRPELQVAQIAMELVANAPPDSISHCFHVGYYLVGNGRKQLERVLQYKPKFLESIVRFVFEDHSYAFYFGMQFLFTFILCYNLFGWFLGAIAGLDYSWIFTLLGFIVCTFICNDVAISFVHQLVTNLRHPRLLPRLDFRKTGIPAEYRTAVVVPLLFNNVAAAKKAVDQLEVQFLANRSDNVNFVLLSDFCDASTPETPADAEILQAGVNAIEELNARYKERCFFLFHRPRLFNSAQGSNGVWMAYERKRGKLSQFNQFLLHGAEKNEYAAPFMKIVGDLNLLKDTVFVVTLDADTIIPRNGVARMVGSAAHPLNRAIVSKDTGFVVEGYGVLQPRMTVRLNADCSKFASMFSGKPGIDPYTTAVSDVYQDLFQEGTFTGKGIYDVEAFEAATHTRFEENSILSHDLIESAYVRSGLVTDVEFFDDFPSHYIAWSKRKHRWVRGDWQLLRWAAGFGPKRIFDRIGKISTLNRWKVVDNLRRSLTEISQLLWFSLIWLCLPFSSLAAGTFYGCLLYLSPYLSSILLSVARPPKDKRVLLKNYYSLVFDDAIKSLQQAAVMFCFIPHQSLWVADAIVRTLYRLWSRRNMLEWTAMSQVEAAANVSGRQAIWVQMWDHEAFSLVLLIGLLSRFFLVDELFFLDIFSIALFVFPLLFVWCIAPHLGYTLSTTSFYEKAGKGALTEDDTSRLLRYALLHWRFFDEFANKQHHWLIPDNVQEIPSQRIAARTSPTNIAMQLMAILSAYDLGFITLRTALYRLQKAFDSMEKLERFNGHWFNWYGIDELRTLCPKYVSSVDSGNLAAALISVSEGLRDFAGQPVNLKLKPACKALISALRLVSRLTGGTKPPPLGSIRRTPSSATLRSMMAGEGQLQQCLASLIEQVESFSADLETGNGFLRIDPNTERRIKTQIHIALDLLKFDDRSNSSHSEGGFWLKWCANMLESLMDTTISSNKDLPPHALNLADRALQWVREMDFGFLLHTDTTLLSIGYDVDGHRLDKSSYDLLASESRTASYIAISMNQIPADHWFKLDRSLAPNGALISWSGTMFEYLMPLLWLQNYEGTLFDRTYRTLVQIHKKYANRITGYYQSDIAIPWGMSESALNRQNTNGDYQYRAFGIPTIALKRGQDCDYVVAPYASVLALQTHPREAVDNLVMIEHIAGALGPYGFRDAIDFTRPDPYSDMAVVRNFMAHHIGMSLCAITNTLYDNVWKNRFHSNPMIASSVLLLHERAPQQLVSISVTAASESDELRFNTHGREAEVIIEENETRTYTTPHTAQPRVALLGTFPYTVMISQCGSGFSTCDGMALYRWRNDSTQDNKGMFIYIRQPQTRQSFSATYQPTCVASDEYRAIFAVDNAHFERKDGLLSTWTRIAVSTTHRAEVRLVSIRNLDFSKSITVDLTSYAEIVLQSPVADRSHKAFGNLFVETEWIEQHRALIARRRPRSERDLEVYGVHLISVMPQTQLNGPVEFETNRLNFIGRGRSLRSPLAQDWDYHLKGETGAVIDPIFSIRVSITIPPGKTETVAFTSLFAPNHETAISRAEFFSDFTSAQQVLDIAASEMKEELVDINLTAEQAMVFQSLFGHMLFRHSAWSPSSPDQFSTVFSQDALWPLGISGDWPILLVMIESEKGLETLRKVLIGHRYWRRKGVTIDLVIVNMQPPTYQEDLQDSISHTVQTYTDSVLIDRTGGVFVRRRSLLNDNTFTGLCSLARVHISADVETLSAASLSAVPDINWQPDPQPFVPSDESPQTPSSHGGLLNDPELRERLMEAASSLPGSSHAVPTRKPQQQHHRYPSALGSSSQTFKHENFSSFLIPDLPPLRDWNTYGGLNEKGDYEIRIVNGRLPPAPWSNVVGTPERIGFLVTERGGGFSWVKNSCMYRLTPWHNDPVTDTNTDVIYLRDDSDGEFWSMTPAPILHQSLYTTTHSPGKTVFRHEHKQIRSTLTVSVDADLPVKISLLELQNLSSTHRRLSVSSYVEWVLGQLREHTQHQVVSNLLLTPSGQKVLVARRTYDAAFANYTAFSYSSLPLATFTCDRREFIGRNRSLSNPIGLSTINWMELIGDKLDPCAVSLSSIVLEPGQHFKVVFLLGAVTGGNGEIFDIIAKLGTPDAAEQSIARTTGDWEKRLSMVQVNTPDAAMNTLLNRWALYQTLSCRIWARSAFYQSGGAFGFRDQLQDMMAMCITEPQLVREHLLLSSQRQFEEGDVLHWWHEPTHRGVRTHISDDLVFLPFVLTYYVKTTGDTSILFEKAPYCLMRDLAKDQSDIYDLIRVSEKQETLYEHCVRAFDRACTKGSHGLPLMGHGDWNDGMNCVGLKGQGESVWLAWFLTVALRDFAEQICPLVPDRKEDASRFLALSAQYSTAANEQWDGAWFRRAYFDSGAPLGSAQCEECKIDSIAQTWSILSDSVHKERGLQALESLDKYLVDEKNRVIKLLYPPFDKCDPDPGYIRGYLPGVRENGAQYTHAAVWTVLANARIGRAERAMELYRLINPLTPVENMEARADTYKVEPYVICADVYSAPQHAGRGGWTWYTGSSAWMYRAGLEYILGFQKLGKELLVDPTIPSSWPEFEITYQFSNQVSYAIKVENPDQVNRGVVAVYLDDELLPAHRVPLVDSEEITIHVVRVVMGSSSSSSSSASSSSSSRSTSPVQISVSPPQH